jgi:hypothetical protein
VEIRKTEELVYLIQAREVGFYCVRVEMATGMCPRGILAKDRKSKRPS